MKYRQKVLLRVIKRLERYPLPYLVYRWLYRIEQRYVWGERRPRKDD